MSRNSFQEKQDSFPLLIIHSIWKQQLHRFCHPNFCVNRGAELCMTERMKKYLDRQNAFSQEYGSKDWFKGPNNSSDLTCLQRALEKKSSEKEFRKRVLINFGFGNNHRLRFNEQKILAKNCFEKIIDSLDAFCREYESIWGQPSSSLRSISKLFQKKFKKLYETEELNSLLAPYRLYDLFSHKYNETWTSFPSISVNDIRWKEKLSLLFAMLKEDGLELIELTSIDELVARFEFYQIFTSFVIKKLGLPRNAKIVPKELITKDYGDLARQFWKGYLSASSSYDSIQPPSIGHSHQQKLEEKMMESGVLLPHERMILGRLKTTFLEPLTRMVPSIRNTSIVNCSPSTSTSPLFRNLHSSAYHPFKHNDVVAAFFPDKNLLRLSLEKCMNWKEDDFTEHGKQAINDYLRVMQIIIQNSKQTEIKPTQFDYGTRYTFSTLSPENNGDRYKVIAQLTQAGVSYVLTCH